ncbi:MAG: polysaccharide deacetylase family protein [bacterium]
MIGTKKNIPVLMYHRIANMDEREASKYVVDSKTFREQLRYFSEQGYTTLKLGDLLGDSNGDSAPQRKPLLITFDDGYLDTFENALPALRDFGYSAIVFVVADLSRRNNWWDAPKQIAEARLMEPKHMIEMNKHGIEFGSHGITHRSLPLLSNSDLELELHKSKTIIEEVLEQPVPYFAYPYGEVDDRVKNATISSGYDCAFASNSGPLSFHSDLFEIRRVLVANFSNPAYLFWKLSGLSKTVKWGEWIGKKVIGKQPAYTL